MRALEELMTHSTLIVGVAVAVLCLAGLPKKKWRYRTTAIALAVLNILAAGNWYLHYAIGQHYFPDQSGWTALFLSSLSAIAAVLLIVESFRLRYFRKQKPN